MKEKQATAKGCKLGEGEDDLLAWIDERFLKSFAAVQVMSIILRGHKYGYDIIKFVEKEYGIKISAGTLYPVLQWLEDKGYIKGVWEPAEGKPGKKTYEVTKEGQNFLCAVKERLYSIIQNLPESDA